MKHYTRIGEPTQLNWSLYGLDNNEFSLEGLFCKLYYIIGRGRTLATGVVHQNNTLSWTFTPSMQWATGFYSLLLEVYDSNEKIISIDYADAFYLGKDIPTEDVQQTSSASETRTINIKSVHDVYKLTPVVPVVGSDGYWYVNGVRVVDGDGQPVPASHTLSYDSQTNYLIIDAGRVDKDGQSIEVVITDIASALINYGQAYREAEQARDEAYVSAEGARDREFSSAEGTRASAEDARKTAETDRALAEGQGDYSDPALYPNTRRAKEAARQAAEAERVKNEGSDGPGSAGYSTSRIKMEIDRRSAETQRQTNEGIGATDAECAVGSRRKNESIRQANEEIRKSQEETRQAQEGTPSDAASATGSRWARYKKAEADREAAYDTAEASRTAGMAPLAGYYACGTAASTAAKEVAATNYVLTNGGSIKVKFTYANSASSPTLNINSTGAKAIVYNGAAASASNTWAAGEVVEFYYDPTYNSNAGAFVGIPTVVSVSQNTLTTDNKAKAISVGGTVYNITDQDAQEKISQLGQDVDKKIGETSFFVSDGGYYVAAEDEPYIRGPIIGYENWKYCQVSLNGSEKQIRFSGVYINSPNTSNYYGCGFLNSNNVVFDALAYDGNSQQGNLYKDYVVDVPAGAVGFVFSIYQNAEHPEQGNYGDRLYCCKIENYSILEIINKNTLTSQCVIDFDPVTNIISYTDVYTRNFHISSGNIDASSLISGDYYLNVNSDANALVISNDKNENTLVAFTYSTYKSYVNIRCLPNIVYTIKGLMYSEDSQINHDYIESLIPNRNRRTGDSIFFNKGFYKDNPNTRMAIVFPVLKGELFRIVFPETSADLYALPFSSPRPFAKLTSDPVATPYYGDYRSMTSTDVRPSQGGKSTFSCIPDNDCYIQILFKIGSEGTTEFTDALISEIKTKTKIFAGQKEAFIKEESWNEFYLGDTFLPRTVGAEGISSEASNRVSMSFATLIPDNTELTFVMPNTMTVLARFGKFNEGSPFDAYNSYVRNGSIITIPNNYQFVVLCFLNIDSSVPLTAAQLQALVRNGQVSVYYKWAHTDKDIVETNVNNENYIQAMFAPFASTSSENNNPDRLAKFIHISDLHGDSLRYDRALQYAKYLGVDYVLVTGDIVMWKGEQGCQYVYDLAKKYNQKVFVCVGNHDSWGRYHTMSEMSDNVIMPCITAEECTYDSLASYPTYYYKDFSNHNIRLICLNQYDTNGRDGASGTYYTQQQIDWFISVLTSTPNNYGVVVIEHTPDVSILKDSNYPDFYQDAVYTEALATTPNVLTQIVDAFISRQTINTSVTQRNWTSGLDETLNLVGDFSSVDNSVEFLLFANGHAHSDRIGYAAGATNKILIANICSGNAQKHSTGPYVLDSQTDLPRRMYGITQDAFNFYAIDRTNKKVRVARIGSNFTTTLSDRKLMAIPYAD